MSDTQLLRAIGQMLAMLGPDPTFDGTWQGWRIRPVLGGANNRVVRATNDQHDLAIKWTIRDGRRRAHREYTALRVLEAAGLYIAPRAVLLDEAQPQPVVVQTWLEGPVVATPPSTDHEWDRLLEHFTTIHTLTYTPSAQVERAVLTASNPDDCRTIVRQQLELLPPPRRSDEMLALIQRWETTLDRPWTEVPMTLCRVDANTTNFVRRAGAWASVDWENSGWGDPAFEIADLMAHPAHETVEPQRWAWVTQRYCALRHDPGCHERIAFYHRALLVWWVVRFSRYVYDIERGADQRLVERPAAWRETVGHKIDGAFMRAWAAFANA